ncbi:MAG: response regulator [Sulfurimonas sp.]|nr:response regulator [Sulfurimonas sp.]
MYSLNVIKAFIIAVALFIYAIIYTITTNDKEERIELLLNQQNIALERSLRVITGQYKVISDIINHEIFNSPETLKLFYKAKHAKSEEELAIVRHNLYTHVEPHFEHLTEVGVNIMHFIFEDNTSFLRVHKPGRYGDNLSAVRYSVDYVNTNKKPIHGFEKGKVSHAFRNIFPIFYSNEYLGAVDLSFSSDSMQENMIITHNIDTHFIVNKNVIESKVYNTRRNIKYTQSIEHKDFLFTVTPNHPAIEENHIELQITTELKKEISKNIEYKNSFSLYKHESDNAYIISFLPVKNLKEQKTVAYLVSYTNSPYLEKMLHAYIWVNIMSLFVLTLLAIIIYSNVKQRLLLQKEVKERTADLEEEKTKALNTTKSKSQFLANMSHEIRTPMNGVIGMSHLLLQTDLNQKQKNFLEKIDESAKSLLVIINDILDFSKIEAGKLTIEKVDFNLFESVKNIINRLKFKANEKNIRVHLDYDTNLGEWFYGDSLRISQILTNLFSNAIKFTNDGEINISVKRVNDNTLRFEVRDTGIGLSKKQQTKLFKSFSQTDGSTTREYGGTGLGLAISKQLVELMDGKIWVESEKDIGSNFIFELELQEIEDKKIEDEELPTQNTTTAIIGNKVLIVEDNITNQLVLLGLLEDYILEIDVANNGQEAVDMFKENNYELIFMDIQMPIMDGYEATKIIRELDENIPIIALTANAMIEDTQKTIDAGMNEHITKPLNVKELFDTLRKYIKSNQE